MPSCLLRTPNVDVEGAGREHEIVGAITAMAHALGMTVVAEGIETEPQLGELRTIGCDQGQGFLLARPVTADHVLDYLVQWSVMSASSVSAL